MTLEFAPAAVMIAGALVLPLLPTALHRTTALLLPVVALALIWMLPDGPVWSVSVLGYDLVPLHGSRAGRLFGTVFAIMAFTGTLFAMGRPRRFELSAALLYAGAAIGVTGAGDLVTVFIFWELMAIGSTLVLWAGGPAARRAAMRYALMHLLGGVLLMAGLSGHVAETGSIMFDAIPLTGVPAWLILIGFLINAGAPPFSGWLPDAYPEASPAGTVFLSAFTTKTAVFVLLVSFAGNEILIWAGLWMVFYGIIYGLLENDIRRILAYSIVNQVGFMVAGIGIGTELALNGAAAHAFTHIIYKALLLMAAGSVMQMTGKRRCSDLGGLFKSMPLTTACAIVGALSISAFPFTSGFVSKGMVAAAAAHDHMLWVWLLLNAGAAGVFLDIAMKWVWFVFFQRDKGIKAAEPPLPMRLAMLFFAFLCLAIGLVPGPLYALLPYRVDYVPYTLGHVVAAAEMLLFAGLAFVVFFPLMKRTRTLTLDTDWLWRRLLPRLYAAAELRLGGIDRSLRATTLVLVDGLVSAVYRINGPRGALARDLAMGTTALVVVAAFALLLVFELIGGR